MDLKEKKKILYVQTIQRILLVMSNFVLGGIVGGIVNILCAIRNILASFLKQFIISICKTALAT